MKDQKLTICYFGVYRLKCSRNAILIKGLRENGVNVIECVSEHEGLRAWPELVKKYWRIRNIYQAMVVGYPGFHMVLLAKLLTRKPIIFDAFMSLYDSVVWDRKSVAPESWRAKIYWFWDWLSCKLADKTLLDAEAHIDYFVKTFGIKRDKFERIFLGSDDTLFYPVQQKQERDYFLVHFHGHFIPLQGIEYIIRAAKLLENENIRFNIIGGGQTHGEAIRAAEELAVRNIQFIDTVPHENVKDYIAEADVCLGIFGETGKARRVIVTKVYEALACRKAVITAETEAVKELLKDGVHCCFCKIADAEDLALKILELKNRPALRLSLAENGYQLFREKLRPSVVARDLLAVINKLLSK